MELLSIVLLGIAAYLIGSISPSYFLVHFIKHRDIREVGSRNAGTLNTFHELGPWWALLVLVFDAGKGAVAVLLPTWIGVAEWGVFVTAPLVIAGHNWPVILKFRGGKGAASLMGICLGLVPVAAMLAMIPGVVAIFLSKNAIVGLVLGFITLNLLVAAAWLFDLTGLVTDPGWRQVAVCLPITLLVAAVYGFAIRNQLIDAVRQRSLRRAFYGPQD